MTSIVHNVSATNTSHTTEIDSTTVDAETLLLWDTNDVFQPICWADRLETDIDRATLTSLEEANHWVMIDRPDAYRDELAAFLLD
jgi:haloalkane dehalogenase